VHRDADPVAVTRKPLEQPLEMGQLRLVERIDVQRDA
jgi:hypothetical protein